MTSSSSQVSGKRSVRSCDEEGSLYILQDHRVPWASIAAVQPVQKTDELLTESR
jgi:hypothetical protein